ncbi:adenylate kinase 8 isoform X1 [Mobula birostris]|uniref:adenylate kinase 8 isoform X1 n=1 Tax=Mobula birostris TaxID=1983395 RepID=UPI003B284F54
MDATKKPLRISPELGVYAEKHCVFQILQRMLQCLLVDKPQDPIQYMIDHFKKENDEVPRVFLLGPPVSGKFSIAKMLCDQINTNLITLDNMLAEGKSETVDEIKKLKAKAQDIPNTLWAKLILERLSKTDCIKRGWVLVDFPRTREQAMAIQEIGIAPEHVVILDAPDTVLIERNLGKRIDPETKEIYHTIFNWPTSTKIQNRLEKPPEITEEETVKRLLEYRRVSHGVLNSYSKKYHIINADQPSVDVFSQVLSHVQSRHRSVAPYTPRIILHGPPGSGRSLQAAMIAEKYRIVNVSSGQLLREAVAAETRFGETIKPYVESRQPVPDVMVMKCVTQRLSKLDCSTRGWVMHGFPQDLVQAEMLKDAGFLANRLQHFQQEFCRCWKFKQHTSKLLVNAAGQAASVGRGAVDVSGRDPSSGLNTCSTFSHFISIYHCFYLHLLFLPAWLHLHPFLSFLICLHLSLTSHCLPIPPLPLPHLAVPVYLSPTLFHLSPASPLLI